MKISIFGSGYVGLVQAAVFADVGHDVICMDQDGARIDQLQKGDIPFYEPGLKSLIKTGVDNGLLSFTDDAATAIEKSDSLFICVGTPSNEDGTVDLSSVLQVAESIGKHMNDQKLVVTKSTVPVGTAEKIRGKIQEAMVKTGRQQPFDVVANPEFLKEGSAVSDCQRPDRIILGVESEYAEKKMRSVYSAFNRNHEKIMVMDPKSAELTKYAANALLATKISFMNEMANIAELVGADIEKVRRGIGADPRIGFQFIYPGCGYGGSCFPKDVRALQALARQNDFRASVIDAVHERNDLQKKRLGDMLLRCFGNELNGKVIALWGLAFKPNTDDTREAPSRELIESILTHGAAVRAYDPQVKDVSQLRIEVTEGLMLCDSKEDALLDADALVICTEWKAFWSPDFDTVKRLLKRPLILDGRNLYEPAELASLGFEYYGIGRGLSSL